MKPIVCDTGPINYLVQIESISVLPALFRPIFLPNSVFLELISEDAPGAVREWAMSVPDWIEIRGEFPRLPDSARGLSSADLDTLALALHTSSAVLLDDLAARTAARALGLHVTGTLGILELAAESGLLSLRQSIERLRRTNIRVSETLYRQVLERNPRDS